MQRGIHHMGFATFDYERCVDFYTRVLGFEIAWQELQQAEDGTVTMRHVFFDIGGGSYMAFMAPTPESGAPASWPADLDKALGLRPYTYHFSLRVDSEQELQAWRDRLVEHGVKASAVFNHGWCRSVYFTDPDGLQLEFCYNTRVLNEDDKILKPREQPFIDDLRRDPQAARESSEAMGIPLEAFLGGQELEEARS
ncbi:VOC family protein [Streptomyces sp. YU58]|uniref:VOC family protein n=1 Tax=Streptomyces sp. SX92 TaxID=3158972 RepID=UPI0027BA04B1|nr:VOC family protein [Streptomyces coralus]WLW50829.1 VOC family protein [Streptomyces coralus]